MTYGSSDDSRLSKNERREAAREKARITREQQKKKDRRNKFLLQGGLSLVALAIVAVVTFAFINGMRPAGPGPLNMASDGIKIGENFEAVTTPALDADASPVPNERDPSSDVIDIQVYVDYLCPICGSFEAVNNEQIAQWVKDGAATIEIHPIAILTNSSQGTQYSLRAANAAACVANYDPNSFFAYNTALFADQPEEGSTGLTNEELFERAEAAGVAKASQIETCINDNRFKSWAQAATTRALNGPIPGTTDIDAVKGTPTVLVNGMKYNYTVPFKADEFAAFVIQAAGASFNEKSTSTPTPTPEPGQ